MEVWNDASGECSCRACRVVRIRVV
jgi:hypothetical protein